MPYQNVTVLIHEAHSINFVRKVDLADQLFVSEALHVIRRPDLNLTTLAGSDHQVKVLVEINRSQRGFMLAGLVSLN